MRRISNYYKLFKHFPRQHFYKYPFPELTTFTLSHLGGIYVSLLPALPNMCWLLGSHFFPGRFFMTKSVRWSLAFATTAAIETVPPFQEDILTTSCKTTITTSFPTSFPNNSIMFTTPDISWSKENPNPFFLYMSHNSGWWIPGSSRYVKFMPKLVVVWSEFRHNFYTLSLEDPGIYI